MCVLKFCLTQLLSEEEYKEKSQLKRAVKHSVRFKLAFICLILYLTHGLRFSYYIPTQTLFTSV